MSGDLNLRPLPSHIEGYGPVRPFTGVEPPPAVVSHAAARIHPAVHGRDKLLKDIEAAFDACRIESGATLSFHHHLRNGDQVLNQVMATAAARGLRDLRVAASSLFAVHAPLVEHMRSGVVSRLATAYVSGPVADALSHGVLATPVVMQTHGGRARAIESGELHIDVAFVAAPAADRCGNLSGSEGRAACGPLGYAMVDARHADRVVGVTDHLAPYPLCPIDIAQDLVDFLVPVASIGDPAGILSGTTQPTTDPRPEDRRDRGAGDRRLGPAGRGLLDADRRRRRVHRHLDVRQQLMRERGVQGSFGAGGVTGYLVDMLEAGLFRTLFDVQCFDLKAVESYRRDRRHQAMSASLYANPHNRGAVVDQLDAMLLGAAEIDLDFNVNVTTGAAGRILGGSGGHADTAAGAKLALVTTRLSAGGGRKFVDRVGCVTTPGETIDAVVTEAGVAVHPRRTDLCERLRAAGIEVLGIEALHARASATALALPLAATPISDEERPIVGVVQYRDGRVIDVIRRV